MARFVQRLAWLLLALTTIAAAAGCARFGGGGASEQPSGSPAAPAQPGTTDLEAGLRDTVSDYITANSSRDSGSGQLVHKKPYFFKEYSDYPEGPSHFDIDIQETDSRTAPYRAKATMKKQRFATRLHRKRNEAVADANYLRDTGEETVTFELRNGRWWRRGSLFVAQQTEEYINGEWVPAQEEVERTVATEEPQESWWQRAWSMVTGR
jgi:hypothetical protein